MSTPDHSLTVQLHNLKEQVTETARRMSFGRPADDFPDAGAYGYTGALIDEVVTALRELVDTAAGVYLREAFRLRETDAEAAVMLREVASEYGDAAATVNVASRSTSRAARAMGIEGRL